MMQKTLLAAGAALVVLALFGSAAKAENQSYKGWFWKFPNGHWCLTENNAGPPDCGFQTFEQCNVSRNGTGGSCNPNPYYVDKSAPRKRKQVER